MSIVDVTNLRFKYKDVELFNDVSFRIFKDDHVGLVGLNGCGKTTLLNLISKNLKPDKGKIEWINNLTIGYIDQHLTKMSNITINEYLYEVFSDLFKKEEMMENLYASLAYANENEYDKILNRATSISDELIEKNFYAFKSKVGNIISGLGIDESRLNETFDKFSGGQRMKILLGKLLLEEPDLLLMDEPTNFLDVKHIEWLTKYLQGYKNAFVVVSHDVDFLNNISTSILSLENSVVTRYKGNYEKFLIERDVRNQSHEKSYLNQQKLIKKTEEFIEKNITRASTHKRALSRAKMLSKLEILAPLTQNRKIYFNFPKSREISDVCLEVNNLTIGYDKPLLKDIDLMIRKNQKIVITGKNGVGKSTLIKTLIKDIDPIAGDFKFSSNTDILYFSQDNEYDMSKTPFEIIKEDFYDLLDKDVRSILARVGIGPDLCMKKLSELSGGEITKVRLCRLSMFKSNLLILDEPSNHLDVDAKDALLNAIKNYQGVVILVSHEKEFYQKLSFFEINIEKFM